MQSAATKYHIPRETLRRHYQRYLKVMGINNTRSPSCDDSLADPNTTATNNNSKNNEDSNSSAPNNAASAGFSSLMDIGQAYGIWNSDVDGASFRSTSGKKRSQKGSEVATDEKDVVDEDHDIDDEDDDNEPLSPGMDISFLLLSK